MLSQAEWGVYIKRSPWLSLRFDDPKVLTFSFPLVATIAPMLALTPSPVLQVNGIRTWLQVQFGVDDKYAVDSTPSLVILDGAGHVIRPIAHVLVENDPTGARYPWPPAAWSPIEDVRLWIEALLRGASNLREMISLPCFSVHHLCLLWWLLLFLVLFFLSFLSFSFFFFCVLLFAWSRRVIVPVVDMHYFWLGVVSVQLGPELMVTPTFVGWADAVDSATGAAVRQQVKEAVAGVWNALSM